MDLASLTEEDRTILFWALQGYAVRRWTPDQDVLFLLGILACPEGHSGDMNAFWLDGVLGPMFRSNSPPPDFSDTEGFDLKSDLTAFNCHHPDCAAQQEFFMPEVVRKSFGF